MCSIAYARYLQYQRPRRRLSVTNYCSVNAIRNAQYTPPTLTRLNWRVESRRRRRCELNSQNSSRRPPMDSDDNLETDQTNSIAVWLHEFWSILITFSTITSLCRHLSPTAIAQQRRIYCKLGHDCRRVRSHRWHDATRFAVGKFVQTRRDCRQLVANSVNTADATQLDSWVESASAVCIGLKLPRVKK